MMATKDQERAALAKIKKIVEGLGDESYIGKAFEGCFDDAESNIDNDFWNSMAQRYKGMLGKEIENAKKIKWLEDQNEKVKKELHLAKTTMHQEAERANNMRDKATEYANKAQEKAVEVQEQKDKIAALELENMKLKAKLYDMMVGA